ncbi:undecaprenyl-diphosphate phosphatase [Halostella pelagica]|uniref:undecaprenyl-diphosphate phosphatase n=1 Tax=Halostella pelagica TaxID=2583824 RepID=UPI0010821CE2|nr:undecaprenyl-diphosphate phosphatase [Halostella pelagica]
MDRATLVALVAGILQGIFEWLPISSEGNVAVFLTAVGSSPGAAVQFSLFLHVGTALSASVYYREEILEAVRLAPDWRASDAFDGETADLSFLVIATFASFCVGLLAYLTLDHVVGELSGGLFVAGVGVLLVATGVFQRLADEQPISTRTTPTLVDAVLVGALQGLAVLPGVSRSGTTVGALLLRGHDGPESFRLSFLLSVPAALGAGALTVLDEGGIPSVDPLPALVALTAAAIVGYLTIDALMRVVERVDFWAVCLGLGSLATLGGVVLLL